MNDFFIYVSILVTLLLFLIWASVSTIASETKKQTIYLANLASINDRLGWLRPSNARVPNTYGTEAFTTTQPIPSGTAWRVYTDGVRVPWMENSNI